MRWLGNEHKVDAAESQLCDDDEHFDKPPENEKIHILKLHLKKDQEECSAFFVVKKT